jgi:ribonuclease-3
VGALYLDQGYDAAKDYISRTLLSTLEDILTGGTWLDPKSKLQEQVQDAEGFTPIYRVLQEEGPDHEKVFVVGVFVNEQLKGQGSGASKQDAQVAAATEALKPFAKS